MNTNKNVSLNDVVQVMNDNLLPSGSRIIDVSDGKSKQVYPKVKKIIKGNIAEELGYSEFNEE